MAIRNAKATWKGTLKDGNGQMNFADYNGPYTFASRFEEGTGTNPEELAGAAHAGCYSMFLSALISGKDFVPESVEATATVHLGKDDTGPVITHIGLEVTASVDGLSEEEFQEMAAEAKKKCPISRLFAGTTINLNAKLV